MMHILLAPVYAFFWLRDAWDDWRERIAEERREREKEW